MRAKVKGCYAPMKYFSFTIVNVHGCKYTQCPGDGKLFKRFKNKTFILIKLKL